MKLSPPTRIFVLHCWQVEQEAPARWRFRLEIPATQEALTFTSLYDVFAYLMQYLHTLKNHAPSAPEGENPPEVQG